MKLSPEISSPVLGDIVVTVQEWRKCPYEWGLDNMIITPSSQGNLALCWVSYGKNNEVVHIKPVLDCELLCM